MKYLITCSLLFLSSCVILPVDNISYHPKDDILISDFALEKYNKHLTRVINAARKSNLTKMCRSWRKAKEVWMISYQKEFVDSHYQDIVLVDLDKLGGLTEVAPHLPYLREHCN